MRKLLHIGWHKTGTTTISSALNSVEPNIEVTAALLRPISNLFLDCVHGQGEYANIERLAKGALKKVSKLQSGHIIDERISQWRGTHARRNVSGEELRIYQTYWANALNILGDDYEVMIVYRDIGKWLISQYKQDLRSAGLYCTLDFDDWVKANKSFLDQAVDLKSLCETYSINTSFNIQIIDFDDLLHSERSFQNVLMKEFGFSSKLDRIFNQSLNKSLSDDSCLNLVRFYRLLEKLSSNSPSSINMDYLKERLYHMKNDEVDEMLKPSQFNIGRDTLKLISEWSGRNESYRANLNFNKRVNYFKNCL